MSRCLTAKITGEDILVRQTDWQIDRHIDRNTHTQTDRQKNDWQKKMAGKKPEKEGIRTSQMWAQGIFFFQLVQSMKDIILYFIGFDF